MTARTGSARAYTVMTMFSGLGGGALGFQRAGFRVLAGVDRDVTVTRGGEAQTYRRRRVLEGATLHGPAVELTARGRLVIQAPDGTWHRPLTTLELAVLQGLPSQVDGEWLQLDGRSDRAWRQRVGNAVPPPTAEAIARSMLATLRASDEGRLLLSSTPRWVAPEVHP